jgi:hypothetical protein
MAEKEQENVEEVDAEPVTSNDKATAQVVAIEINLDKLCDVLVLCTIYLGFIIATKKVG